MAVLDTAGPLTANDPSAHLVMAVLDTAIHAFAC
jgi:hypothetical protein